MTIREFCKAFIVSHGISFAVMSKTMGYKSTNSLYRLMDEPVWLSSLQDFRERLENVWTLTEQENADLEDAIADKLYGTENAGIYQAMHDLVFGGAEPMGKGMENPFLQLATRYQHCKEIRLTIFNGVQADVIEAMRQLIGLGAQIDHYFMQETDTETRIRGMALIYELLFDPAYNGYIPAEPRKNQALSGISKADIAWCDYRDAHGVPQTDIILLTEQGPILLQDSRILRPNLQNSCIPIKKKWAQDNARDDYIAFCKSCADMDFNRRVLCIKPDLCYGMITGDYLSALTEHGPLSMITGFPVLLEELTSVFNKRFENNMTKKRHCWYVMKKSAMERFMETGRLTDHLWAMRPFTPDERRAVLQNLLDRSEQSYYVHLLLLRDEEGFGDKEIDMYEGKGLLLQSSSTDYNLSGTYSEAMVTHPVIIKWFREYFMNVIVKHMCMTESESMAVLRGMLE